MLNSTIRFVWPPAICKPKREKIGEQDNLDTGVVLAKVTPSPKLVQDSIEWRKEIE